MSDKVFTKKMTLSICLIILCLCALSISAGAYFTDSKNSQAKTFSTATYDLTITPVHTVTDNTTSPATTENKTVEATTKYVYDLAYSNTDPDSNTYDVTVAFDATKATAAERASGYAKIVINDANGVIATYYTKQIARADWNEKDIKTQRSYKLVIDRNVTVTFIPLWGTYSGANGAALADGDTMSSTPAP
ncbi:MAG: hypothetical protein IKZ81_07335 [Clostridia bacterium]|nr:hypothetical protein [Clostridia bacterium]